VGAPRQRLGVDAGLRAAAVRAATPKVYNDGGVIDAYASLQTRMRFFLEAA
jgi:hypothetical protein